MWISFFSQWFRIKTEMSKVLKRSFEVQTQNIMMCCTQCRWHIKCENLFQCNVRLSHEKLTSELYLIGIVRPFDVGFVEMNEQNMKLHHKFNEYHPYSMKMGGNCKPTSYLYVESKPNHSYLPIPAGCSSFSPSLQNVSNRIRMQILKSVWLSYEKGWNLKLFLKMISKV